MIITVTIKIINLKIIMTMIRINICFKIQYGGFTFLLKDGCPPQTGSATGSFKVEALFSHQYSWQLLL